MKMSRWLSTIAGAAALSLAFGAAQATVVNGYYSYNGGALTALPDFNPAADQFTFIGGIQNFFLNIDTATGMPSSAPNLLSIQALDNHVNAVDVLGNPVSGPNVTDNLRLYFVSDGNSGSGTQNFLSQFSSNALPGSGLSLLAETYVGAPGSQPLASLATLIGSASFPPNLLGVDADVTAASVVNGYTVTAFLDITATGITSSNATIAVSPVPAPIVGAGIPGLIMACGGLFALARRRRRQQV